MKDMSISLASAVVITERSRRTWWRRIAHGLAVRTSNDVKGRAMVRLQDVVSLLCVPLEAGDLEYLVRADGGDAEAQADIGQLFFNAGKPGIARYWLELAAAQKHPDAMQWLGRCYIGGEGVPRDCNMGIMWIANAAAHGHAIAQAQMKYSLLGAWYT